MKKKKSVSNITVFLITKDLHKMKKINFRKASLNFEAKIAYSARKLELKSVISNHRILWWI